MYLHKKEFMPISSKQPDNKKKDGPSFFSKNWNLFLLVFLIFASQLIIYKWEDPDKTDWQSFKTEMLATGAVSKIDVVNKEQVEVYVKSNLLGEGDYSSFSKNNTGPHFYFDIGSVEAFESKLEVAQKEYRLSEPLKIEYSKRTNWFSVLLSWMFPVVLFIGLWMLIMRRSTMSQMGDGRSIFDFGKTAPRVLDKRTENKTTFKDVAGLESAIIEVKEIVTFLKSPEKYTRLGAKIPKGMMLVGPPGTGKTLLAKAIAGEADVPFFSMSGSEFVEMFVGVGASRVRDLFKRAKVKAPSIIFIDEIDAVGRSRGKVNAMQTNDERESTLNQLLTEMDGFADNSGVIVLAATNRPDILDKALLRPGRFDRHIYLELPNVVERTAIFKVHSKKLLLSENINLENLAVQTPGFSGADIANVCNEAALIAARKRKDAIEPIDFESAIERIVGGLEHTGKIISESEKKIIAYHEAGHATVSWFLKHADQLIKVTIVPRGKSLGAAWYKAEERQIYTKAQLKDRLCSALGGRAAEALMLNDISSGGLDDLEKVTKQAYSMVAHYGLSEKLGNISFYDSKGDYQQTMHKIYSEETATIIDDEVRKLIDESFMNTMDILSRHRHELIRLAEILMEKEVVYKEELEKIFGVRPMFNNKLEQV